MASRATLANDCSSATQLRATHWAFAIPRIGPISRMPRVMLSRGSGKEIICCVGASRAERIREKWSVLPGLNLEEAAIGTFIMQKNHNFRPPVAFIDEYQIAIKSGSDWLQAK